MNGCQPVTKSWNLSERDVFVLRRTQQVVRAVDQKTGEERYCCRNKFKIISSCGVYFLALSNMIVYLVNQQIYPSF